MTKVQNSRAYQRATSRADEYLRDAQKLRGLYQDASARADVLKGDKRLARFASDLKTLLRLVRGILSGQYRRFPMTSLALVVSGLLYFVWPLDLCPDVVPVLGLLDDVTLLAWIVTSVRKDLDLFREWEASANETIDADVIIPAVESV